MPLVEETIVNYRQQSMKRGNVATKGSGSVRGTNTEPLYDILVYENYDDDSCFIKLTYTSIFMCVYQIITPLKLIVNIGVFLLILSTKICLKHLCQLTKMHQNVLKTHVATGLRIGSSLIKQFTEC